MAAELDKLAKYFHAKGFHEYAEEVHALAKKGRVLKVPEHFVQTPPLTHDYYAQKNEETVKVLFTNTMTKTMQRYKAAFPEERGLTLTLASMLNDNLKGILSDNITLTSLLLPRSEDTLLTGVNVAALKESGNLKGDYNRALRAVSNLKYYSFKTLGDLRNIDDTTLTLMKKRSGGAKSLDFILTTFARREEN